MYCTVSRTQAIRLMEAAQQRASAEAHWRVVSHLVLDVAGATGTIVEVDPYRDPARIRVQEVDDG